MNAVFILLGGAAALFVVLALYFLRGRSLAPVRSGECTELTVAVKARGDAPELEAQLAGLDWLRGEGLLYARVRVADNGLSPAALERVGLLAERFDKLDISVCDRMEK